MTRYNFGPETLCSLVLISNTNDFGYFNILNRTQMASQVEIIVFFMNHHSIAVLYYGTISKYTSMHKYFVLQNFCKMF